MKTDQKEKEAFWIISSEILFAVMPLIVLIFITLLTTRKFVELFQRSDISFISVFYFGQTLVRFISGIAKSQKKKKWQIVAFFITVLFLIGIIPSILLLLIIYLGINTENYIYVLQSIWLIMSLITYFIFGEIGQIYLEESI